MKLILVMLAALGVSLAASARQPLRTGEEPCLECEQRRGVPTLPKASPQDVTSVIAEPAYCREFAEGGAPDITGTLDSRLRDKFNTKKTRLFELGKTRILTLPICKSGRTPADLRAIAASAQVGSGQPLAPDACTFNLTEDCEDDPRGRPPFSSYSLKKPSKKFNGENGRERREEFFNTILPAFKGQGATFLKCARQGFIALGCGGMVHRGPTVVGMLLAYSGCRPESALKATRAYWGDDVNDETRLTLYKMAYDSSTPAERVEMQSLFGAAP
jgi:hypothetical protein